MKYFTKKYWFFRRKIRDVTYTIWETEFKISKSRQVREGVRQDRDRAMEGAHQMTAMLQGLTDTSTTQYADTAKQLEAQTENVRRYEAQMRMIDEQINGISANGENPGQQGILDMIKGYTELRSMYKDYLKQL